MLLLYYFIYNIYLSSSATLTVGDGTLGSCTEESFNNSMTSYVDNDEIIFNCAPITYCNSIVIYLTQSYWVPYNLTINGATYPGSSHKRLQRMVHIALVPLERYLLAPDKDPPMFESILYRKTYGQAAGF